MIRLDQIAVSVRAWDRERIEALVARCGGRIHDQSPGTRWLGIEIEEGQASEVSRRYAADPDVEGVEFRLDATEQSSVSYHAASSDSRLDAMPAFHRMGVFQAWRHTMGSASTWVGVVDTGIAQNYASWPEFAGKAVVSLGRWGYAEHGTFVSELICAEADNADGTPGVAPGCSIVMAPYDDFGIAGGIVALVDYGVKVINVSMGSDAALPPDQCAALPPGQNEYRDALVYARDHDVLVVMAAGNSCRDEDLAGMWMYPGSVGPLLGHLDVGCLTPHEEEIDKPVRYTSRGSRMNITAPGDNVWAGFHWLVAEGAGLNSSSFTTPVDIPTDWVAAHGDAYRTGARSFVLTRKLFQGTSSATPLVTGVAALVRDIAPGLTSVQARDVIVGTADKAQSAKFPTWFTNPSTGVANAGRAVSKAKALASPGSVVPWLGFHGAATGVTVEAGVAASHLRGAVGLEIDGFSTDPLTRLALYLVDPGVGEELIWEGTSPRTTWTGLLPFAAARLDGGKRLKIVVSTATVTSEEEYTDVLGYATSSNPPRTVASPAGGTTSEPITLTAEGQNPPFTIEYRWDGGAWQLYTGPIAPRSGTLECRATDVFGNREGG